jgi:hypothetical protein
MRTRFQGRPGIPRRSEHYPRREVAGTGGVRKVRIALQGGGKSGGPRAIYYFCDETMLVFLIRLKQLTQESRFQRTS